MSDYFNFGEGIQSGIAQATGQELSVMMEDLEAFAKRPGGALLLHSVRASIEESNLLLADLGRSADPNKQVQCGPLIGQLDVLRTLLEPGFGLLGWLRAQIEEIRQSEP